VLAARLPPLRAASSDAKRAMTNRVRHRPLAGCFQSCIHSWTPV